MSCHGRSFRRRIHVVRDAVGNPFGGGLHRLPCKVGVAVGRLDLAVPEQLADHRQSLAERERPGREGTAEVMEPHVLESGLVANQLPRCVQIGETRSGPASEDNLGIVGLPGHGGEHLSRRRRQPAATRRRPMPLRSGGGGEGSGETSTKRDPADGRPSCLY